MSQQKPDYHIAFVLDKGYIQHTCVAAVSLLHNNPQARFTIHCLHDGASVEDWEKLEQTVSRYDCQLRSLKIEEEFSTSHHFKAIIPEQIQEERVLYFDSDLVINGSIQEIYEVDLDGFYLAAVEDLTAEDYRDRQYMSPAAKYFNAGVMLFNLPKWREENVGRRALAWIKDSEFPYDQEGLNAIVDGAWLELPLRYNQQTLIFHPRFVEVPKQRDRFSPEEFAEAKSNPVIVHYTGMAHKPWRMGARHPHWALYWKYIWKTPFRFARPDHLTPGNVMRSFLPESVRSSVRRTKSALPTIPTWAQIKRRVREVLIQVPFFGDYLIKLYRIFVPSPPCPIQATIARRLAGKSDVFFVQIGSNDGVQSDPLRDLILKNRGWRGIFVEPVGFLWRMLRKNYGDKPRFAFENVAISVENEHRPFYYVSEEASKAMPGLSTWTQGIGSFSKKHLQEHLEARVWEYIEEEQLECVNIQTLFDRNRVDSIDILHIDTEGFDYKVLSQVDFDKYRPAIVLYEHVHLSEEEKQLAHDLLERHGYEIEVMRADTLGVIPS